MTPESTTLRSQPLSTRRTGMAPRRRARAALTLMTLILGTAAVTAMAQPMPRPGGLAVQRPPSGTLESPRPEMVGRERPHPTTAPAPGQQPGDLPPQKQTAGGAGSNSADGEPRRGFLPEAGDQVLTKRATAGENPVLQPPGASGGGVAAMSGVVADKPDGPTGAPRDKPSRADLARPDGFAVPVWALPPPKETDIILQR